MLYNKTVVVTGGSKGIGKAIALKYAEACANVVILDIDKKSADEIVKQIRSKGVKALAIATDITKEAQVNKAIRRVLDQFKSIDVLISNAGLQHISPISDLSFNDWKKIISIHLDGAFLTSKAVMKAMIENKNGGSIIFMGSVHSKLASSLKAPYVTAKHGIIGLSRTLAKEGAQHNIRANTICPGFVETELVKKQIPEQAKKLGISEQEVVSNVMLKDTVNGEFTSTDDVANVAVFLSAFPSNALTGQSILVSHGWHME